MPLSTN